MHIFWIAPLLITLVSATSDVEFIPANTTVLPGTPADNTTIVPAGGGRSPAFSRPYRTLITEATPSNFFEHFKFFSASDPTHGYVRYLPRSEAKAAGLIQKNDTHVYIGVDYNNRAPNGRASVRLESKELYTGGLFILDVDHLPWGCGVWPAWWTFGCQGTNWPKAGEIDIIEGIHNQVRNSMVVHTVSAGCVCTLKDSPTMQTGLTDKTKICNPKEPNQVNKVSDSRRNSFGPGFNGGVYAMEWTDEAVKIWFFPRGTEPIDALKGTPTPGNWGMPAFHTDMNQCGMKGSFRRHRVIFNITFCGDWAGIQSLWEESLCASTTRKRTCVEHVTDNPSEFKRAHWLIRSMKVWKR